jgi:hypothetical protein
MKKLMIAFAGILAFIYLLNPTFGVFEFVPDNIPFIGNLDEATAMMVLLGSLRFFGWDLTDIFKKHKAMNFGIAR